MKGVEHSELINWDGPLPSSSYRLQSTKDVPSTSFFKSTTSSAISTPASYSSSTSSQCANDSGEDSDCYIIDAPSSVDGLFDENCGSTRTPIKHSSSIERLSAAHMPELFQPSNLDALFPFQHTHDTSAADEVLTQPESYLSSSQHSIRSVPTSFYAAEPNLFDMSIPPLLTHHDVIELSDDEDDSGHDSIKSVSDPDNEDEEMAVDDMLTEPFSVRDSSPSPEMGDSLFTPPPSSRKPRRRIVFDCITKADYRASNTSTGVPQQGVEHPSVGHALAAASAQNDRLMGKGSPARHKRKYRPRSWKFGEDISTLPTQILDAQYPALELDIHELPDFLPHHNTILRSNTHYIYVKRVQRLYAQLHEGLPEMIAEMKGLAAPDDEKDEKEDGPVFPRVLAPLFEERPDIEAALTPYFGRAAPKGSSRKGKIKSNLEPQNAPSSSKPKLGFTGTDLQIQDPSSSNVLDDISHYTALEEDQILDFSAEMDQYLNDLSDSPAKTYLPGIEHTRSAPSSFIGFLHNTTRLPPDAASVTRENGEDSFFGVPPSPRLASESPSLHLTDAYATNSSHSLDGSFDLVLPEDGQWSLSPTIERKSISTDSLSPSDSAGTIDPSLLGGSEPPLPSTGARSSKPLPSGPIIYVRRPPGVSASQEAPALSDKTPGKSRRNVQIKYRTSKSASVTDEGDETSSARKMDDGEVKDDGGWTAETVSAPPVPPGARPSLKIRIRRPDIRASSDGSFVPSKASSSASSPVFATPFPETKLSKVHAPPPPAQTTPQDDGEPEVVSTFCHQCRSTQTRPKMQCSKRRPDQQICGKRFCNRCILNRYPETVFAPNNKKFVCPVCLNTCNCSICARRRGEEYISARGGGFAGSRTKSGILLVPDDSCVPNGSVTPEPSESAPQTTTFWAHVYGLEGERVGRAFIDGASASAPVRPTQPAKQRAQKKQKVKTKLKKKPRVFIGTPLREWNIRTIQDLEPSAVIPPLISEANVGKGKGKAVERPRVYIGDARWLYVPYTRMPVSPISSRASSPDSELDLDSDGTLTPLEDLEGMGWPQPDVGESVTVTWGSARAQERSASSSLSPDDLVKAIGVALAATREDMGE
ncbi:uncharacterized protein BJ212DRAFT_1361308 [Suillus subaureus]|uniref:Zinc-finger domain-containing protein n=1 Tax=Suillus subaureus TaxID=48587 RepID=A0A9P7JCP4_9AGAM|nr:uncharacterized protein BJ212DRAFT_1361308 [Suillus subaureus]KAG1814675.1 hypothetical protein BJ212DRAFT_1361308 [Suillus subaureus]